MNTKTANLPPWQQKKINEAGLLKQDEKVIKELKTTVSNLDVIHQFDDWDKASYFCFVSGKKSDDEKKCQMFKVYVIDNSRNVIAQLEDYCQKNETYGDTFIIPVF